jgi:hypothetical protein
MGFEAVGAAARTMEFLPDCLRPRVSDRSHSVAEGSVRMGKRSFKSRSYLRTDKNAYKAVLYFPVVETKSVTTDSE